MLEKIVYTIVPGKVSDTGITVYALSTCGFCKRAIAFLDRSGLAYRHVYLDKIPIEDKNLVKSELKERYGLDVSFPFAVIGGKAFVGFIEKDWERALGL